MGRYTGPKNILSRREGINLYGDDGERLTRRLDHPPGMHGRGQNHYQRQSDYSM